MKSINCTEDSCTFLKSESKNCYFCMVRAFRLYCFGQRITKNCQQVVITRTNKISPRYTPHSISLTELIKKLLVLINICKIILIETKYVVESLVDIVIFPLEQGNVFH